MTSVAQTWFGRSTTSFRRADTDRSGGAGVADWWSNADKALRCPFAHQCGDMPAANDHSLQAQDIAQHPAAQKRPLRVQLIEPAHQLQIRLADRHRLVIQRGPRELQQLRLLGRLRGIASSQEAEPALGPVRVLRSPYVFDEAGAAAEHRPISNLCMRRSDNSRLRTIFSRRARTVARIERQAMIKPNHKLSLQSFCGI